MRHLRTLIILATILIELPSYAQRIVDAEAIILSPPAGSVYYSQKEYTFRVGVINNGPDRLYPTDSYQIRLFYGGIITFPEWGKLADTIAVGDTFLYSRNLKLNFVGNGEAQVCAEVLLYSSLGISDSLVLETEQSWKNNKFCHSGLLYDSLLTAKTEIIPNTRNSLPHPNPTVGYVFIPRQADYILLIDCIGQVHSVRCGLNEYKSYFDISSFPSGIYFLLMDGQYYRIEKQ
ncbi:MAG: hypothetical protein H6606_09760 [Flavobacteriales bacterium]|nr:hypothetical protein [Flavobacteriales bacterium]